MYEKELILKIELLNQEYDKLVKEMKLEDAASKRDEIRSFVERLDDHLTKVDELKDRVETLTEANASLWKKYQKSCNNDPDYDCRENLNQYLDNFEEQTKLLSALRNLTLYG